MSWQDQAPGLLLKATIVFDAVTDFLRSRLVRLTFSLMLLIASVLLLADVLQLRGDESRGFREARKMVAETLAVQLSALASVADTPAIKYTVSSFVSRNDDVTGAALIDVDGEVLEAFGEIDSEESEQTGSSTLARIIVPIYEGNQLWGRVVVSFQPDGSLHQQFAYFGFVLLVTSVLFLLFLRKSLEQLNPRRAIPGRVTSAFNLLSDGVVILDERLRILMVNSTAAEFLNTEPEALIGQRLEDWPWQQSGDWQAPWTTALDTGVHLTNQPLRLKSDAGEQTFMVSCAAIGEQDAGKRGVLVTLDDMTIIERKNHELAGTLRELRRSQQSISEKNRELEALATQDPLTGLANRRALVAGLEKAFLKAQREQKALSCVMVDIDHFKRVNDSLGHAAGDEVICAVAGVLVEVCREYDVIGRYGGEEFAVILSDLDVETALQIAERIRLTIEALGGSVNVPVSKLSASLGVAGVDATIDKPLGLIDRADQALYAAKQSGRNRVCAYDAKITALKPELTAAEPAPAPSQFVDESKQLVETLEALVEERTNDLNRLKEFDLLTGIPERSLFLRRVETELKRAERFGTTVGVISLEIREFERLLTTLGHGGMEALTVEVVQRLQHTLRETDAVLRIADDHSLSRITANEYGVLLADLDKVGHAMPVVTRIRRAIAEPFEIADQKVYVGANIGTALFPEAGRDADSLIENASVARQKAALNPEKISHTFSSAQMDEASRNYVQVESDLYDAVQAEAFQLYYQPKYNVVERRVSGMEALLRWQHPERGWVSPEEFIPIAESNGLINEISEWVVAHAVHQLKTWRTAGLGEFRVSVNVSPIQLRDPALASKLLSAIASEGLPHEALEVELTESTVVDTPQQARLFLNQLREAGVKVSIDDFGTGYSSLALLAELSIDYVKIDRSFVRLMSTSEKRASIVESIINMAHALKLEVVGEGIETNEQLHMLTALGCQEIQGYLIGKPMPADEATAYLRAQRASQEGGALLGGPIAPVGSPVVGRRPAKEG